MIVAVHAPIVQGETDSLASLADAMTIGALVETKDAASDIEITAVTQCFHTYGIMTTAGRGPSPSGIDKCPVNEASPSM